MRPVNLIPAEERPGGRKPMRGGPLAYIIVGALAAAVIGVAVLAVTSNQISDSKAEIAKLEDEKSAVEARAQALDAYTQFHSLREQRLATVTSLADSRFDWQRVMRELAIVLPGDVWLTTLSGTASSSSSVDGGGGGAMRSSIAGPALELNGCATGQDAVAGFVQALKQIDGVTRVGVESSKLGEESGGSGASSGGGTSCQTRSFIAQFQMVVAFDAAPVASEPAEGETAPAPAPEPSEATPASAPAEGEGG
jgi:Tfp pilus assembly protein PilN